MSEPTPSTISPEAYPSRESLFPFAPESVVEGLANLEQSSNEMLELITYARGPRGPADGLYANLPVDDLTAWHQENEDFTDRGTLLYKAGLLYGIDLANHIAQETDVSGRLRLTNPDAYQKAVDYLKESYRGLEDDPEKPEWLHQKERELLYTGSDILTLANAALNDRVRSRLTQLYGDDFEGMDDDELAQHVGIVDGAILVDSYRAFSAGRLPHRFEQPEREHVPTYRKDVHVEGSAIDLFVSFSIEDLSELLDLASINKEATAKISGTEDGRVVKGIDKFIQVGPNKFAHATEILAVEEPRVKFTRVNYYGMPGALLDIGAVVLDQGAKYFPVAYGIGLLIGYLMEKPKVKNEKERYQRLGIAMLRADETSK